LEMVLRGSEASNHINIYEVYWMCAYSGPPPNRTEVGQRNLFMVRKESAGYHLVIDFQRSIYPIYSGKHSRLPLDDSHPFWERYALMNWWVVPGFKFYFPVEGNSDPRITLYPWRRVKLLRGLLRHPSPDLRLRACQALLDLSRAQDECWDIFAPDERQKMRSPGQFDSSEERWEKNREWENRARAEWRLLFSRRRQYESFRPGYFRDEARLFTTINNRALRTEFCRLFLQEFPDDHDNGCPADRPPPATIVTENGDVPLTGPWPQGK